MAITKVINDAVDLNQTTDYSGLRLPVGTTGNVVESFTTDYLVVGGGGSGSLQGAGGAGGLRTSYNNSTTTTNSLSFPSGKTAIATYMLDNNATDLSGNYNGAETNITYNTGQYGGAAVFNGSSSKIDTGDSIISTGAFSASFWTKLDTLPSASSPAFVSNISNTGNVGFEVRINYTNDKVDFFFGAGSVTVNSNSALVANTWYHIACTYDGTNLKMYIDGNLQTQTSTGTLSAATNNLHIGKSAAFARYIDGSIDQVRIYNTALSSSDVTNIYNNEVQANSGGGTAAESSLTLSAGTAYDVTVGAGGIDTYTSGGSSGSGANSIFSTITSTGGGGAGATSSGAGAASGKNGGSGGGAGANTGGSPGSGTLGQGYIGGTALFYGGSYAGGGGGGALGAGGNTTSNTVAGNGGAQLNLAITGNLVGYAGGGGGSLYGTGAVGTNDSSAGAAAPSGSSSANGESAPFNLGGGGGGSNHISGTTNITGGAGGSGVVILRYPTASVSSFTTTGTLNTPSTTDTIADTAYPVANTAYYKLDNSAIDLSGSTGKFDQAGVFNGSSSYIVVEDSSSNTFGFANYTGTASAWVNINSFTAENNILAKRDSGNPGNRQWMLLVDTLKNINFIIYNSDSNQQTVTSSTILNASQWYHIAVTLTTTNVKIYINGVLDTTASSTYSTIQNDGADLQIGRRGKNSGYNYFNGSIDQVRLYNVALSSTDVTALYNETVSTTGQLNFPSGQTAIATYELNGNANGILTTTDLSTVNYPAGAGCIALYEMNETADDTSGVYNGTPSNIDYNFGAFGQAAVFNGSSSVITINSLFDFSSSFSISMWFNADALPSSTYVPLFVTDGYGGSNSDYGVALYLYGNTIKPWIDRQGTYTNIFTAGTLSVGTWYHVALNRDYNSEWELFLNGSSLGTYTGAGLTDNYTPSSFSTIGKHANSNMWFDGKIDQVRIYNSAPTQSQVTTLARGIGTSYSGVDTNVSYAYNGTPTNVTYENGRFNKAAIFNGSSSRITLPIGSPFNDSNTIKAISAWIKAGTSTSRVYPLSISSTSNANDYWYIGYMGDLNAIYVATRDGSSSNQSIAYATITPDTGWHHIVVQLTATGKEIYLDGISQTITNSNSGTATNTSWINYPSYSGTVQGAIGVLRLASISYGKGSIDQIRIFSSTLSAANVTDLYNEHYQTKFTDGSDTAIVFTEGTGTVTFSGVDPAPPQGALRANTSYSEDGSGSVIEHYNGTDWKYFDAIKYCTTNTLNFPSGAGCIASYNLDNNVNDIGNTYNGVNSNVTFNASGKFGTAAVFNGSSSAIVLPNNILSSDFSISAWFYLNNTSGNQYLFEFDYENRVLFRVSSTDNNWAYIGNSGYFNPGITYNAGQWYNVVITFSNGNPFKIYVNGVLSYTSGNTSVSPFSNDNILGAANSSGSGAVNGLIDQVRIFNDSLTSDEVAQLYNNEIACS